jgi:hypothetical protein
MFAFAETDLSSFKWKNRVLVVLAPSDHDPRLREQQAIAAAAAVGFSERDLIVVAEIGIEGPLHRMFGTRVRRFSGRAGRQRWAFHLAMVQTGQFRSSLFRDRQNAHAAR